jgi:hypothetical protein
MLIALPSVVRSAGDFWARPADDLHPNWHFLHELPDAGELRE